MSYVVECICNRVTLLATCATGAMLVVGMTACASVPVSPAVPTTSSKETTVAAKSITTETVESRPQWSPTPALTQTPTSTGEPLDHAALLDAVLYSQVTSEEAQAILEQIGGSGDTRFVAGLIDTLRYHRRLSETLGVLSMS